MKNPILIILLAGSLLFSGGARPDAGTDYKPGDDGIRFGEGPNDGWVATWGGLERDPGWPTDIEFIGGDNSDEGRAIVIDEDDFIYVAGPFNSRTDFDPGPGETILGYKPAAYLSKFDTNGNLIWAKNWRPKVNDMAMDSDGNLYMTGGFSESVDLNPATIGTDCYDPHFYHLGYVSCLDSDGNYLWGRSWGAVGTCITVSDSGTVYVGGQYTEFTDFEPGPGLTASTPTGYGGAYLSRFSVDGKYLDTIFLHWDDTQEVEDEMFDQGNTHIMALAADEQDNLYLAGEFGGIVDFDLGEGIAERNGGRFSRDFLCKLNSEGEFQWVGAWGQSWGGRKIGLDIAPDGDILITGTYQWYDDFDPGPEQDMHEAVDGYDIYVSRLNSDGEFQWARTWGGRAGEQAGDVTVSDDGNVYVTGLFQLSVDLDPGPGEDLHGPASAGGTFVVALDEMGEFLWADSFRPTGEGQCGGQAIAAGTDGSIFVTGSYAGLTDFDPGEGEELHNINDAWLDAFLLKLNPDGSW